MRALAACLLVCSLAAPAAADATAPPAAPAASAPFVLATLQRTACYGTCPIYRLTIYSDGRVVWEGEQFVKVKGKAEARLTADQVAALRAAFAAAKYTQLEDHYDCYEVTDNPSANTSFQIGGKTKTITHYHGCRRDPATTTLSGLENKIDEIAGAVRWVGTPAEREKIRRR
jgi:hypothetical protein